MVKSTNCLYEMKIINAKTKKQYKEVKTPDGWIVIVERGDTFEIELSSETMEILGAKLYIDGYEFPYKKTWKKIGRYKGFKLGFGHYNQFQFCIPDVIQPGEQQYSNYKQINQEQSNNLENNKNHSTIQVKIFKTKQSIKHGRPGVYNALDTYRPSYRNADKKLYTHCLTVDRGEEFQIELNENFLNKIYNSETNERIDNEIIQEDQPLANFKICYTDYHSALTKGYIMFKSPYHMQYIPDQLLKNPDIAEKCIYNFMNWFLEGLSILNMEEKFYSYSQRKFKDLMLGPLEYFVQQRPHLFRKCEDGDYVIIANGQEVTINNFIPQEYFKLGQGQNNINQQHQQNENEQKKKNLKDPRVLLKKRQNNCKEFENGQNKILFVEEK